MMRFKNDKKSSGKESPSPAKSSAKTSVRADSVCRMLAVCVLLLAMTFFAAGCGGDGGDSSSQAPAQSADSGAADPAASPDEEVSGDPHSTEGVDEDLTKLSSTMVYAEISNIMVNPDEYKGKVIRLGGLYATYKDEATGQMYFACVNQDATACCAQGIEFILPEDEYTYPDDYPAEGDEIVVQGTFDTYMEGEYMYPTLRNATLIEKP